MLTHRSREDFGDHHSEKNLTPYALNPVRASNTDDMERIVFLIFRFDLLEQTTERYIHRITG